MLACEKRTGEYCFYSGCSDQKAECFAHHCYCADNYCFGSAGKCVPSNSTGLISTSAMGMNAATIQTKYI